MRLKAGRGWWVLSQRRREGCRRTKKQVHLSSDSHGEGDRQRWAAALKYCDLLPSEMSVKQTKHCHHGGLVKGRSQCEETSPVCGCTDFFFFFPSQFSWHCHHIWLTCGSCANDWIVNEMYPSPEGRAIDKSGFVITAGAAESCPYTLFSLIFPLAAPA